MQTFYASILSFLLLPLAVGAQQQAGPVEPPDLGTRGTGSDWTGYLGPLGDARSTETGIVPDWPPQGPPLVWQAPVGEGYSMPSIARGRLFMFDRHGDRARLTCMHSETGKELWRSEYRTDYEDSYGFSNGPRTSPVVDGERVYTFGVEGRLRCHRVVDGGLIWEVDTAGRFGVKQNFFGVGSTPVVEGSLLIAQVGGSPSDSPGVQGGNIRGNGSAIVAFDKLTGRIVYRFGDELASYSSPVLRSIAGRRWGFVFARGGLIGFEPATGRPDFRFPWRANKLESVNASNPVVVDNTVFITESYGPGAALLEVRPAGYEVVRRDPPGRRGSLRCHWSTPVYHEGYLYGSSGSSRGEAELRAVNHRTGELMWSQRGLTRATLLYADGLLIVLTEEGQLLLVRATPERYEPLASAVPLLTTGTGPTRRLIEYPAWNAPVLSHGLLYVRGKDRLACLELIPPSTGGDRRP